MNKDLVPFHPLSSHLSSLRGPLKNLTSYRSYNSRPFGICFFKGMPFKFIFIVLLCVGILRNWVTYDHQKSVSWYHRITNINMFQCLATKGINQLNFRFLYVYNLILGMTVIAQTLAYATVFYYTCTYILV